MNERDWKLLLVLHEYRSITRAAGVLHLTQPALSTRLRIIEEFFKTSIVIRSRKGVQFTAEGEFLVRKAREQISRLDAMRDTLNGMKDAVCGTLRIGASHFFTKYVLPTVLRDFKKRHSAIEYNVRTGWSKDIVRDVLADEVHVGFIRGSYSWAGIRRLLFTEHMRVVHSEPFSLERLPQLPLIQYRNDPTNQLLIDNWWAGHFTVPPKVGMTVDKVDTCLEMVKMGLGYGFFSSNILRGLDHLPSAAMRSPSGKLLERSTWMILKPETMDLRLVREFVGMIEGADLGGGGVDQPVP